MRASSLTPSHMRCSPAARLHPVSLRRPPRLASLVSTACNDGAAASLRPEGPPAFLSRQGGRRKKTTHSLDGTGTRDESHRATLSATHSVALSYCDARGKRGECVRASAHASEFGPSGSGGGRQGSAGRRDGGFLGRLRDPEVVYRPTEEWLSRVVESASRRGSKAMWKWWSMLQLAASAAYVVLYVYSTYVKLVSTAGVSSHHSW